MQVTFTDSALWPADLLLCRRRALASPLSPSRISGLPLHINTRKNPRHVSRYNKSLSKQHNPLEQDGPPALQLENILVALGGNALLQRGEPPLPEIQVSSADSTRFRAYTPHNLVHMCNFDTITAWQWPVT